MSLTMARSSFSSAFNRVDLPAFVSPMMATGTPFLMALPTLKDCTKREITCSMPSCQETQLGAVGKFQFFVVAEVQLQFYE